MMSLPDYLKSRRETQGQFAARVGTTQANVSKLCGDNPKLSPDLAVRIEKATEGAVPVEAWPQFRVLSDRHFKASQESSPVIPSRHNGVSIQPPVKPYAKRGASA